MGGVITIDIEEGEEAERPESGDDQRPTAG